MSSQTPRPPITVTHEGGVRFAAQIRSHRIVVDQPVSGSGGDTGPTPLELLGASLGTCVALYVQQFLRARGMPCTGMRVEVETQGAQSPSRIGQFVARVMLPMELPEAMLPVLERAARSCPAHNTLARGAEIAVEIHTATPAASVAG